MGLAESLYKTLLLCLFLFWHFVYRVTDCSIYFNDFFFRVGFFFVCGFQGFFFSLKLFGLHSGVCTMNISISKPWSNQGRRKFWSRYHHFLTSCTHFKFWTIDTKLPRDFHEGHRGASSPNWPSHECTPVQQNWLTPLNLEIRSAISWLSLSCHVRCHLWGVWDPLCAPGTHVGSCRLMAQPDMGDRPMLNILAQHCTSAIQIYWRHKVY